MDAYNGKNGNSKDSGVIISSLNSMFGRLYELISKSMVGAFLSSHSSLDDKFSRSLTGTVLCDINGSKRVDARFEESSAVAVFRRIKKSILRSDMMTAVLFLVLSVFFVFIANVIKDTASESLVLVRTFADLLVIILFAVPSLLVGFTNRYRSLGELISESRLMQIFFNDILGVGDEYYYEYKRKPVSRASEALLLALIVGVISYFVSPLYIAVAVLLAFFTLLVASIPEAGVMSVIFFLPFSGMIPQAEAMLLSFAVITEISVTVKISRGKRRLHIGIADALVLLFAMFTLFGGISIAGGLDAFLTSLKYVVIILFYFPIKCVICDVERVYSCFALAISSGLIVSLVSLFSGIVGAISGDAYNYLFGAPYDGRLKFPFETSTELGVFLAVTAVMCFGVFGQAETRSTHFRRATICIAAIMCVGTVLTYSVTAVVSLIIGLLIFLLLRSHKTLTVIMIAAAPAVLLLVTVFPLLGSASGSSYHEVGARAALASLYRGSTWESVFELIRDNWFAGVGTASFDKYYPQYAVSGTEGSVNCGSLYLDIFARLGVFGFVIFVFLIFTDIRAAFEFIRRSDDKALTLGAKCTLSAVIMLCVSAFACSIWHDVRLMLIFWILLSLMGAILDVGYRRAEEERHQFLLDENAVDMRIYM